MRHYLKVIFLILSVFVLTAACSNNDAGYTVVDFDKTAKADTNQREDSDPKTLKVAVGAMISPKYTLASHQAILNYIGRKLGYHVQLIQRDTYAEVNELISRGQVDIAFICSGPYAAGKEKYGFEALVTPVVNGEPFYQAYLIVRKDSPYKNFSDLKGHTFAFTDPDSNTGYLVPKYWLSRIGETPDSFFSSVIYTHSHDNSIMAVAKSMVDGASVGSSFWEYFQARDPVYTSRTRVIKKSVLFGGPPLVASKYLSNPLKLKIRQLLLKMHEDPEGMKILKELRVDSFRPTDEAWYASVKQMKQELTTARIKSHHVEKH